MNKIPIRKTIPLRKCKKTYSNYRQYKDNLKDDFNGRCGYCDLLDVRIGGKKAFHIDHFAPKKAFGHLETVYSNLVYACPSCNLSKSNDWPMPNESPTHDGKQGYIDPCDVSYDQHLYRAASGEVIPSTDLGIYISRKLKLYLRKHQIFWAFEQLLSLADQIKVALRSLNESDPEWSALKANYSLILEEFHTYYELMTNEIE